ncbi:MAG: LEPR-XLL domain-containing protein, partial [Sulfitobacter sp.]|nr:LEPR-XLL domain-containing protein [Sulfitobacter sp.]
MSMPFDRQAAGVLPKIPLNRRSRARLRRNNSARFDKIREAAWRLMLDPMEQRVLLSADPMSISAVDFKGENVTNDVIVRFFEDKQNGDSTQKVGILWSGGTEDITEIGVDGEFIINMGSGNDNVSVTMEEVSEAFTFSINTEDGYDTVTFTDFATGFVGDMNLTAEQININANLGVTDTEVGKVTLTAADDVTGSFESSNTASANVLINANIISDGAVSVSATAVANASQASYVASLSGFDLTANATVAVGENVKISGESVSLTADTRVEVSVTGDYLLDAIALTDIETTTTVSLGEGVTIDAGAGFVDGVTGDPSLRLSAITDTDATIDLKSAANFFSGVTDYNFTDGFDLLISDIDVIRNTSVEMNGSSGNVVTLNALGLAEFTAKSDGTINNLITSNVVGVATTDFKADITNILGTHLASETLGISMQATSMTQTVTEGKIATNESQDTTSTAVSLSDSVVNAGAAGVNIGVTDGARFYATSTSAVLNPDIFDKVDLDYAAALNLLDRDAKVTLTSTTVDADGAVAITANSAVWSVVVAEKMRSAAPEVLTPFVNEIDLNNQKFVFGGTMAVNEMNGDVGVTISGDGTIDGSTVTITAENDAIFSSRAEAGQSMSGKTGGAVGISVAMNVLGFNVANYLLLGIDALIGIGMGASQVGYGASVSVDGTAINTAGAALIKADNQLKANAFMSNAAESTADSAFKNNSGYAVAFALATNKIATRASASVTNVTVAGKSVVAGSLDVNAVDNADITAETLVVSESTTSSNFGISRIDALIANFAPVNFRTNGTEVFTDGIQGIILDSADVEQNLQFGYR